MICWDRILKVAARDGQSGGLGANAIGRVEEELVSRNRGLVIRSQDGVSPIIPFHSILRADHRGHILGDLTVLIRQIDGERFGTGQCLGVTSEDGAVVGF